jgi:glycosyltransferase involved in cell wall biosynthesis
MKVLALTRYTTLGASSRLRFFQYQSYLNEHNFDIHFEPFFDEEYLTSLYIKSTSVTSVLSSYYGRVKALLNSRKFDLIWVEKEVLPWLPSWVESLLMSKKRPIVVDYDDATFHRYDKFGFFPVRAILGRKIDQVMKNASIVVAGNNYIAERALAAGAKRVEHLPTVVDTNHYAPKIPIDRNEVTIGWIGSRSTARHLNIIQSVINEIGNENNVKFIAVGANPIQFANLPLTVNEWSEDTEVDQVQEFDIGIMPLPDEPFERGKCGYKLIQYMACGKPVVASPVGVNKVIVNENRNGFLASTNDEWNEKLRILINNPELRYTMGKEGREIVEERYSLQFAAPKLVEIFNSVI